MRRLLYIAELLLLLILVICGVAGKEQSVLEVSGEVAESWASESFSVTPGVYRVAVDAEIQEGSELQAQVKATQETVFRALLSNPVKWNGEGQDGTSFYVYATDSIEQVQLSVERQGGEQPQPVGIIVYKTRLAYVIGAVLCLLLFGALDMFLYFYRLVREKKISISQQIVVWVLLGSIVLTSAPYLSDYVNGNVDILRFSDSGLLNIPAAFLKRCGFPTMETYRLFVILVNTATALSAWFCFRRCVESRQAALFGTVFYVLMPWRISSVYVRGDMGEALGMVFFPLLLCGVYRLLRDETEDEHYLYWKYYMIAGLSGLIQSRLPLSLPALFVVALGCLLYWKRTIRRQTLLQLAQTLGIGVLINAGFWLPAMQEVTAGASAVGGDSVRQQLSLAIGALLSLGLCLWAQRPGDRQLKQKLILVLGILMLGISVYQINDIVYNMTPAYVYSQVMTGAVSMAGERWALSARIGGFCSLAGTILLVAVAVCERRRKA